MIRLGWADMTTSSSQLRSRRFVYFAWTHSASQFDRFPPPCPTTSRLRDIPTGNIRLQEVHSSSHVWLSKLLCGRGGQLERRRIEQTKESLICFIGRHLGAGLQRNQLRPTTASAS